MEGSPGCRPRESAWWADRKEGDTDVPSEHLYVPFRIPPCDIWVAYHGYTHYRDEKTEVHLGGVSVIHLIHSFSLIQQILMRNYFMAGTIPGLGDTVATKTDTISALWGPVF